MATVKTIILELWGNPNDPRKQKEASKLRRYGYNVKIIPYERDYQANQLIGDKPKQPHIANY